MRAMTDVTKIPGHRRGRLLPASWSGKGGRRRSGSCWRQGFPARVAAGAAAAQPPVGSHV